MKVCKICLRTDRQTLAGNRQVVEFHAEITNNSISFPTYFCIECDYLLKKFHKFKEKCEQASEILASWQSGAISGHLGNLYKMLPPSHIGYWMESKKSIICQVRHEEEDKSDSDTDEDSLPVNPTVVVAAKDKADNFYPVIKKLENVSETDIITEIVDDCDKVEYLDDGSLFEPETVDITKKKEQPWIKKKKPTTAQTMQKTLKALAAQRIRKSYENVFDIERMHTLKMMFQEFERRKTYEYYLNAQHRCEVCYHTFIHKKALTYHMDMFHNENNTTGREKCPICHMWVKELKVAHMQWHKYLFKCKLCPFVTHSRNTAVQHYNKHMGIMHHCDICNTNYKSSTAYAAHKARHHRQTEAVYHVCTTCGRGFGSRTGLLIHCEKNINCQRIGKRAAISKKDGARCDDCKLTFISEEAYRVHLSQVHKIKRKKQPGMYCKPCDIRYSKRVEYYKHLADVHNEIRKPMKTSAMKKNPHFAIKPIKVIRTRPYNPPKYTCRLCSTKGTGIGWLHRHFKKEHPTESLDLVYADQKTHLCEQCGAAFTSDYHLRYHLVRHEKRQPFVCDLCPKRFRSLPQARIHRRKAHHDWD